MIEICAFKPVYGAQVLYMILKIQREEYGIDITAEDQPDLKDIGHFYQRDGGFWVALDGDTVAGTIALKNIGNGNAALRKMFVKKEFRGKERGVAALLLKTLLDWAKDNRFNTCWLGTTPQFLAAHRFYEKNGFREISKEELPAAFPVMAVDRKFYVYNLP